MVWEFMNVIWHDDIDSPMRVVNLSDLKDFHIVASDIISKLEGRHIDDIDIRVIDSEHSGDLSVFSLKELLHGNALELMHGIRVDVNLYALLLLNLLPLLLELFLHLPPQIEVLVVDFFDAGFGLLLEEE